VVVRPVDVDEAVVGDESPDAYLQRVVDDKLAAASAWLASQSREHPGLLVADTAVIVDDRILNKPADDAQGVDMIRALAGRKHRVATRFALVTSSGAAVRQTIDTSVWFRSLDEHEIARYVATGEGRDKAGGYGIQGLAAAFVERLHGDYANVVGLPIAAVVVSLRATGLLQALPVDDPGGA
jgi:nucleoside triphosphate pyrophosphatase